MSRSKWLDQRIRRLRRTDDVERQQAEIRALKAQLDLVGVAPGVRPFLSFQPPGHFYSPVPDLDAVERDAERIFSCPTNLPGLDLNESGQREVVVALGALAGDLALPTERVPEWRYCRANPNFGVADGLVLGSMLRHLRPRRFLEVGSGWSTALALDVNERFLNGEMAVTAIEPYPEMLQSLLRPADVIEILAMPIQDAPIDLFAELGPNDVLFIDCSHVVKVGSDAHHLITRVLPALAPGVVVHIHDIFWPFEYPRVWVEEGRAWSEAYLLHAFLLFNSDFEILHFYDWLCAVDPVLVNAELPGHHEGGGGSIWLRRTSAGDASTKESDFLPRGPLGSYHGRVELTGGLPERASPGEALEVDLVVTNDSGIDWRGLDATPPISIGWRWVEGADSETVGEGRIVTDEPLRAGATSSLRATIVTPLSPGSYVLEVAVVHEGVRWFGRGVRVAMHVGGD